MVKSRSCQDHGVIVGPLRGVAPPRPGSVPVVAPRRITDDALWKALPHDESKVHLRGGEMKGRNQVQTRTYDREGMVNYWPSSLLFSYLQSTFNRLKQGPEHKFRTIFSINVKFLGCSNSVLHIYPSHVRTHSSIVMTPRHLPLFPLITHNRGRLY